LKFEVLGLKEMATVNASASIIPFWLKLAFTAFMFVLVPVYWANYGPTNFLYFCDLALFLVLAGIWTESPLLVSLPAVGILLPQMLWCLDFLVELSGGRLTGLTSYMSDPNRSLFLRGLSLFHGWLPFLVYYLVKKLGYDKRALVGWIAISTVVCLVAYFFLPPPGTVRGDPKTPRNINYVFGLIEDRPQRLLPPLVYLGAWIAFLIIIIHVPTHFLLRKFFPLPASARSPTK
jgi:hypothetical protein